MDEPEKRGVPEIQKEKPPVEVVVPPSDDDYDPYIHREVYKPTTNAETFVHLLKGSVGTGILAMPQAMHHAGFVIGILGTLVIAVLSTYCIHILYVLCKRNRIPFLTYTQSMTMALEQGPHRLKFFAPAARWVMDGFLIFMQLGVCCIYVVFVGENLKQVLDNHLGTLNVRVYMCMILLPMIGINCVKNLKVLAPFSIFANLITFVGLGIIMSYVLTDIPSFSEREMVGSAQDFPLFFGTILFALQAVGVIIALEANMKTPAAFREKCGVLNSAMACVVILYVVVGICGYLKYGSECLGSITLNLPQNEALSNTVKLSMAIAVFTSYALQCWVPFHIIWDSYMLKKLEGSNNIIFWDYALRIGLVLFTFVMAVVIPRLGLFISLIGAFCLSALSISFPAIMEICVYWHFDLGKHNWVLYKDIFLIIFSVLGLIAGTYVSVREIVMSFSK